jgi:repressor LexA
MVDNRPSKKQRELLSFIDGFIKGNGYGPSYREIMRALDYKSVSTVAVHVNGLIARGLLYKKDNSARSLTVMTESTDVLPSEGGDTQAHQSWLVGVVEEKVMSLEKPDHTLTVSDVAILIESLRLLGIKKEHATLRERFDSYQNKH